MDDQRSPQKRKTLGILTNWIEDNYKEEYSQVDAELDGGYVSPRSMPYMVQPGDVLVSRNAQRENEAFKSTEWATPDDMDSDTSLEWYRTILETTILETLANKQPPNAVGTTESRSRPLPLRSSLIRKWILECWSIRFEGGFCIDHESVTLEVDWASWGKRRRIRDMSIYPVRFTEERIQETLANRGRTFWVCRKRHFVSYEDPEPDSWEAVRCPRRRVKQVC
jgi:hypothetical protein